MQFMNTHGKAQQIPKLSPSLDDTYKLIHCYD